jgi:hypothetical protein
MKREAEGSWQPTRRKAVSAWRIAPGAAGKAQGVKGRRHGDKETRGPGGTRKATREAQSAKSSRQRAGGSWQPTRRKAVSAWGLHAKRKAPSA